jgi:enoyl-CoA hydratase/carnithine racemase
MVYTREALRMGLVNEVFPEEGLMEGVTTYAENLASSVSPRSSRVIE